MDFESMKSVQELNIALQQFRVNFATEAQSLKDIIVSQYEREIKEKNREIANLKNQLAQKQKSDTSKERLYEFRYDVTDFQEGVCADDVDSFFENLIQLTEVMNIDDSYIVDTGMAVVPIFKMVTESVKFKGTKWEYLGKMKAFCDYWNVNVVGNIKDETRKASLLCDYDVIKAEMNHAPWKGYGPASWKLSSTTPKHKTAMKRALIIKARMEQIFF